MHMHPSPRKSYRSVIKVPHLQVRDGAVALLDAWASITNPEKPAQACVDAVTSTTKATPDGKVAGLTWLATLASEGKYRGDVLQKAVQMGAKDRSSEVREATAALSAALTRPVSRIHCFCFCYLVPVQLLTSMGCVFVTCIAAMCMHVHLVLFIQW